MYVPIYASPSVEGGVDLGDEKIGDVRGDVEVDEEVESC